MTRRTASIVACSAGMFIIGVFHTATMVAQGQSKPVAAAPVAAVASAAAPVVADTEASAPPTEVQLLVGRSTLIDVGTPISRVSLTSADIADALVTSPSQLLVHGKVPGSISMFVWSRSGVVKRYEVAVSRDLGRLNDQIRELFPGEPIEAHSNGKQVVLSGRVSTKDVVERAVNLAAGFVDRKEDVVTLLQVLPPGASNQVLLRVRFAEVSRTALTELGASFFTGPNGNNGHIGRVTTQQFAAPDFDAEKGLVFSDFLNLFYFNTRHDLGAVVRALQTRGLFESLAEPNLVAESGKEASFLAGGEIPIPVAQGSGSTLAISVVYKEFGVRLNFTPTVTAADRVRLKVRPEVSTLDFANAVVFSGFRIPALSTRRTETELELRNGQTFAIAGLMNNQVRSTMQKVPGIGDIPILGLLFRSKAAQKDQTELVVMITPEILPNASSGVTNELPRLQERFMTPLEEKKSQPMPPPAFTPKSRSQAGPAATPTATPVPVVDERNAIERTQDRLERDERGEATQPVAQPVAAAPAPAVPETKEQKKERERAEKAAREQAQRDAEIAERAAQEDAKRAEAARKQEEKLAREQAKRDKKAAEEAKRQAEKDAKRQAEEEKRQADEARRRAAL